MPEVPGSSPGDGTEAGVVQAEDQGAYGPLEISEDLSLENSGKEAQDEAGEEGTAGPSPTALDSLGPDQTRTWETAAWLLYGK